MAACVEVSIARCRADRARGSTDGDEPLKELSDSLIDLADHVFVACDTQTTSSIPPVCLLSYLLIYVEILR